MPQDVAALRQAVECGGPASPCQAGCRSMCWKIFLLFHETPPSGRLRALRAARDDYAAAREQHLQFIKHPERLTKLTLDPLADDPESPWDVFRRDEVIRAEILQDVRRLPDNPLYHQEAIQTLILDVLFVFCKRHPHLGGYRQGMHELLAPLVAVLHQDACEREDDASREENATMAELAEMLDASMLEHDAYALFAAIMRNASRFYEFTSKPRSRSSSGTGPPTTGPAAPPSTKDLLVAAERASVDTVSSVLDPAPAIAPAAVETSTIVEMSKAIHEETLMRVDPELALHLQAIEILPQIFLIRWIRLLFSREFPFDQLLVLWDRLFAVDPNLDLVPLICVAMLLRIRWELLSADYSLALQALLKYAPPQPPHSPHTFVADAVFLRDHLDAADGAALVLKYTGRAPSPTPEAITVALETSIFEPASATPGLSTAASASASTSSTPSLPPAAAALAAGFGNLRNRTLRAARRSSPQRAASSSSAWHSSDGGGGGGGIGGGSSSLVTAAAMVPPGSSPFPPPKTPPPPTAARPLQPVLSPSPSPARFLQNNRDSMEALLQSAAKGVLGRGQKLGINQAVRDAVGEIRRGIQEARQHAAAGSLGRQDHRQYTGGGAPQLPLQGVHDAHVVVAEMERRNRQLAGLLDETVAALQALAMEAGAASGAASGTTVLAPDERQQHWRETVEIAAAKVQFVKVHLEDASLLLPGAGDSDEDADEPRLPASSAASLPAAPAAPAARPLPSDALGGQSPPLLQREPAADEPAGTARTITSTSTPVGDVADVAAIAAAPGSADIRSPPPVRPALAQSSFAWMLDDAEEAGGTANPPGSSASKTTPTPQPSSPPSTATAAGRRSTDRARHAFLFGESADSSCTTAVPAPAPALASISASSPAPPSSRRTAAPGSLGNRRAASGSGVQRRVGVRSPVQVAADDEVLLGK